LSDNLVVQAFGIMLHFQTSEDGKSLTENLKEAMGKISIDPNETLHDDEIKPLQDSYL